MFFFTNKIFYGSMSKLGSHTLNSTGWQIYIFNNLVTSSYVIHEFHKSYNPMISDDMLTAIHSSTVKCLTFSTVILLGPVWIGPFLGHSHSLVHLPNLILQLLQQLPVLQPLQKLSVLSQF